MLLATSPVAPPPRTSLADGTAARSRTAQPPSASAARTTRKIGLGGGPIEGLVATRLGGLPMHSTLSRFCAVAALTTPIAGFFGASCGSEDSPGQLGSRG